MEINEVRDIGINLELLFRFCWIIIGYLVYFQVCDFVLSVVDVDVVLQVYIVSHFITIQWVFIINTIILGIGLLYLLIFIIDTQNKMKQLQLNTIKPLYDKYGINNNNNDVNDGNNNEDIQERIRVHNI